MYTDTEEYEERGFSLKKILIRFIIIVAIVLVLIGILAIISNRKDNETKKKPNSGVVFSDLFKENKEKVKNGVISYYKEDTLPKEDGKYEELSFKELKDKGIISNLRENSNDKLDYKKSYIKITKSGKEYILKVNIKTASNEANSLFYLGSYDYCENTYICERNDDLEVEEDVDVPIKQSKDDVSTDDGSSQSVHVEEKLYQYVKVTPAKFSEWTDWSSSEEVNCSTTEIICNDDNCLLEVKVSKENDLSSGIKCYRKYRKRTKLASSYTTTRWSKQNDKDLLNNGWSYTGEIKNK